MKSILLAALLCVPVGAQTQVSLHQKYGTPQAETFVIRPGITLTATYTPAGDVREMIVAPEQPTSIIKSTTATLDNELLHEVINELVPLRERGKFIIGTFLNITCLPKDNCAGSSEDYEKLTIYYNAGKNGANYAVIQWKVPGMKAPKL